MLFKISKDELKKALNDIENAEKNGFYYCDSVFKLIKYDTWLDNSIAKYVDMCEKAHPNDPHLNWGRGQNITKNHIFKNGLLINKDLK
jgi:hypothetical protein